MTDTPDPSTGSTLFGLLENLANQRAWERFVESYGPKIHGWCRRWGLREEDALDVTQTVFAKMVEKINTYQRGKGGFRSWLKTVTHHAWYDFVEKQHRAGFVAGNSDVLGNVEARDDLESVMEKAADQEVLGIALGRVEPLTPARDWQIFHGVALQERSPAEVAEQFGVPVSTIYQVKFRVQKAVKEEVARLEGTEENEGTP
jgi:RNA polymerase sigma-70 factor (ECF subfamily)